MLKMKINCMFPFKRFPINKGESHISMYMSSEKLLLAYLKSGKLLEPTSFGNAKIKELLL